MQSGTEPSSGFAFQTVKTTVKVAGRGAEIFAKTRICDEIEGTWTN